MSKYRINVRFDLDKPMEANAAQYLQSLDKSRNAFMVTACYTVGHTSQGIKKSGCQIPRFQRISALPNTENHFLAPWGTSCL